MPTAPSNSSSTTRRHGGAECKPLLDAATKDIFRNNAFRITGLAVDATIGEITKHADRLEQMSEWGLGEEAHKAAFACKPPPTWDEIRDAVKRLKDPEERLIDAFFWFWPEDFGNSRSDATVQAIAAGDGDTALHIWQLKETNPEFGTTAMHNLAIAFHLAALEWEDQFLRFEIATDQRSQVEQYWKQCFTRWETLAMDDSLWDKVAARIRQIADPRLKTGFDRMMRASLPLALVRINAELALAFAEAGKLELARIHIQFMRESNQGLDNVEKASEMVLAPARTRLKEQIQRAQQRADKNPADAASAARELLEHARHSLALLDLFFGKDSEVRNDLSDEIAAMCNQLLKAYHKATGDDSTCLDILKSSLSFTASKELRQDVEKDITTLSDNLTAKNLKTVYELLKALQDSKEHPHSLLDRFRCEAVSALANASVSILAGSEARTELFDSAAVVLRGIALAAWNTHHDHATAVAANQMAIELACGLELKQRLLEDRTSLRQIVAQPVTQQRSTNDISLFGLFLKFVAGIAAFGLLGLAISSVPTSWSSELKADRLAIASAKAEANSQAAQLKILAQEIESDRRFLNQTSQIAVDEFNRKVSRYNSLLEQERAQNLLVNQLVDAYNNKIRGYRK